MEIAINSKYDGLNSTRDIQFFEKYIDDPLSNISTKLPQKLVSSQIKINNLRVRLLRVKNFWEKETKYCHINMTLDTLIDTSKEPPHNNT